MSNADTTDDSSDSPARRRPSRGRSRKLHRKPARPWPLLENGQHPDSLQARVAYHLHRLKLTGRRLRDCRYCPLYQVAEITQGRVFLQDKDVASLGRCLAVDVTELSRPLTAQEDVEWAFYRASASQGGKVWQKAHNAWEAAGWSITRAAQVMGLDRTVVQRNITPKNKRGYRVFPYSAAAQLADALKRPEGAMYFIDVL